MNILSNGTATYPAGFTAGAAACGLKVASALDLMVLYSEKACTAAGMFTRNQVVAAPVILNRETLAANNTRIRGIVANAGIANACTGELGLKNARNMQGSAAAALGCDPDQVLVLSTGVIGAQLPMDKIGKGITMAVGSLMPEGGEAAARAIMTTDMHPKHLAVQVPLLGGLVAIGGMAKGAGMIHPEMATLLAVLTTDAGIPAETLHHLLGTAVDRSFNQISVDGDTSTSDTVLLLASGASGLAVEDSETLAAFSGALTYLCTELARMIVQDGEGASKLVTVHVSGARTEPDAHRIANAIASSPLVKTAFAGSDPNWGRILAAAGRAGVNFDQNKVTLWIGADKTSDLQLVAQGTALSYAETDAASIFGEPAFSVHLDLGLGGAEAAVLTCDLTHDYVTINADYRT